MSIPALRSLWSSGLRPTISGRAASRFLAPTAILLIVACSGEGTDDDEDDGNPTGPPAGTSFTGGWTGSTSQSRPFAMHVDDAGIALIMIGFSVPGAGCSPAVMTFIPFESPTLPLAIVGGSFTFTMTGSIGNRTITGTLTANGQATVTLAASDPQCSGTLNATWTATKATGALVSLTGTWNGSLRSSLVAEAPGSLVLVQSGTALSGTYSVPSTGAGGTVSGTVLGQTARFTMTQTAPAGCSGSFTGHAVLMPSPETLVFFYSGTDCLGPHLGSGTGTRQAASSPFQRILQLPEPRVTAIERISAKN